MRNAPSVIYPVGRSAFCGGLLLALALVSFLAGALWCWLSADPPVWVACVGIVVWLGWALCAFSQWWATPAGLLAWKPTAPALEDPQVRGRWCWRDATGNEREPQAVQWVLDLQSVVLLRLQGPALPVRWLWLDRRRDPACWDGLRRALVAHTV
jgi:toxin CptA